MSDQTSARLGLPYLAAGQLQKHVTLNESLTRLDALVQTAVQSRSLSTPPVEPAEGALFIIAENGQGGWSGRAAGALMRRDMGGWVEVAPVPGQIAYVLDAQEIVVRGATDWVPFSGAGEGVGGGEVGPDLTVERLGVGAEPDATNPFSARLNKALWAARETGEEGGDGDLRFTFSKTGPENVLSLLFQSGFSGRAEIGLIGDDDLRFKVSADGSSWRDVLSVDRATGQAMFVRGATRLETHVVETSGSFSVPEWARWIEVVAVGGGGGGGAGLGGYPGAARYGGGGGGAGATVAVRLPVAELGAASLTIGIGAGGAGGASSGATGTTGGATTLSAGAQVVLTAPGGLGGGGGSNVNGLGAAGRSGGASGGSSAIAAAGGAGADGEAGDRSGGGGAGGGLDPDNNTRPAGAGGAGARLGVLAIGGKVVADTTGGAGAAGARASLSLAGGGGGGGAAMAWSAGRAGGPGGQHGAGGGGGGGGFDTGGAGGAGAGGAVRLTVIG